MTPDTLLHYRLLHSLGTGGMGEVYVAEDTKLGRRVALKVLRGPRAEDLEHRQRFEREAKAVAALNHPNIVTIYAVEQAGETSFLTMELVEGKTLGAVIPKGGFPVDRLLKLAIPLADAVAAAHERGVTHRDLKPQNVMVTAEDRVKILDFGLAKLKEAADGDQSLLTTLGPEPLTGEGRIVGTVAYMSPEQAEGKALDHRTDIFSLGILLYEMATGERPFKGDTSVSVISSILKDAPPTLTDVNRSLPRDLARIVRRALVKDPDHRYQNAKDLRNDLEAVKEDLDSGTTELSEVRHLQPSPKAKVPVAWMAGGAVVLALVIGGVFWYVRQTSAPTTPAARPFDTISLSRLTNTGKVGMAAMSPDGKYVAHVVIDQGKQSLWLRQVATTSNVQIVPPDDVRYDGVSFLPDGNYVSYVVYPRTGSFSTAFQIPVLGGAPQKILDDADTPLTFSKNGRQIAFIRANQRLGEVAVMIAGADGSNEKRLAVRKKPTPFALTNIVWSPDGSRLAVPATIDPQGRMQVAVIETGTGKETLLGPTVWYFIDTVAWMPDGNGLIVAGSEKTSGGRRQIWRVSYPAGDTHRITNDLAQYRQASVSGDGSLIAAVQVEGHSSLWMAPYADPGLATAYPGANARSLSEVAWAPDGRILYSSFASGNMDIWISDTSGGGARQLTSTPGYDGSPVVTRDGKTIVFVSWRGDTGGIWRMDFDGGNQRLVVKAEDFSATVVSPDSKYVYYTETRSTPRPTWRVPLEGGVPERLTMAWQELGINEPGVFYHPTLSVVGISPDGASLLGYYTDPQRRGWRVGLFPLAGGTPKRFEIIRAGLEWTPDGRNLLYLDSIGGTSNIFLQPLDGGAAKPITRFTSEGVIGFSLSRDGKQLALTRGDTTSDVVLIRNAAK